MKTKIMTREELDAALVDPVVTAITISGDGTSFTIPEGDYSGVDLTVDAPKASVVNNGVFNTITIKSVAPNTFTENAIGNIISFINTAAARIIVGADAVLGYLNIGGTGVTTVQVQGEVTGIEVAGTGKADVIADEGSKIDEIVVSGANAEVAVSGDTTDAIKVSVEATAEGATVESSTKVEVTNEAKDTEVKLTEGAAGSTVDFRQRPSLQPEADVFHRIKKISSPALTKKCTAEVLRFHFHLTHSPSAADRRRYG